MLEPGRIDTITGLIGTPMFYLESHQIIYQAILDIDAKCVKPDVTMVVENLKDKGLLETIGGPYTVTRMTNSVVSGVNVESKCRIVLQRYMQREIIRLGAWMYEMGFDGSTDVFDQLDMVEKSVLGISHGINDEVMTMEAGLMSTLKMIERNRANKSLITGVPSGYVGIDRITRGWQGGDLIVIAARPSVGKTAFALNLGRQAAKAGYPGAFFSLEMIHQKLVLRLLSAESGIGIHQLQTGMLTDEDMKELYRLGVNPLAGLPIHIDDHMELSIFKLRSKLRRLVKKFGLKWAIIDYLQLMEGDKSVNREQQIAMISRGLKSIAKELGISIIALSQLSREVERRKGNEPVLADIRESGAIEQDADMVCFLYGPTDDEIAQDAQLANVRYFKIGKSRDGQLDTIRLYFKGANQLFKEEQGTPVLPFGGGQKQITDQTLF